MIQRKESCQIWQSKRLETVMMKCMMLPGGPNAELCLVGLLFSFLGFRISNQTPYIDIEEGKTPCSPLVHPSSALANALLSILLLSGTKSGEGQFPSCILSRGREIISHLRASPPHVAVSPYVSFPGASSVTTTSLQLTPDCSDFEECPEPDRQSAMRQHMP